MIKEIMPNCCIGVDVIVGFPGETEEDFLETYEFLNNLDVSYLHVFTFSERQNTKAVHMDNVVPQAERQRRSKMLRILSEKKKRQFYLTNENRTATVLFEEDVENGMMHGFTENYVRVKAKYDPLLINELKVLQLSKVDEASILMEVEELETSYVTH